MSKDKVIELIDKFIEHGRIGECIKGIEMVVEIILITENFRTVKLLFERSEKCDLYCLIEQTLMS